MSEPAPLAFDGVTVLETGDHFSVPFAARLLRAFGATVIKAELPDGDPLRAVLGGSLFGYLNAGKKSIVVGERAWASGEALRAAATATIWLDGRPPAIILADRAGMNGARPFPVHVCVTPFGLSGPLSGWKASGIVAAAMGGFMHLCGDADGEPLKNGGYLPEFQAGLFAAVAAVAGLLAHESGHPPVEADISLLESVIAFQERGDIAVTHAGEDWVRRRRHEVAHPFTVFECADGFVTLAAGTPRHWANLCVLMGRPEWAEDVVMVIDRIGHADEIDEALLPWLRSQPAAEVVRQCQELFIPCGPVLSAQDVLADAHLRERSFFISMGLGEGREVQVPGMPARAEWIERTLPPAPALGEHTHELIGGAG